jgi:hypothetical protein
VEIKRKDRLSKDKGNGENEKRKKTLEVYYLLFD